MNRPDHSLSKRPTATRWEKLAIWGIVALGLMVRVAFALRQPLWVDEPFSLLAIDQTAATGVPILPSGVLYLHGATLSFLLAPLLRLGWVPADDFVTLRLFSAVAGAVAVFLTYRLAKTVRVSSSLSLFAATLVALDPVSIEWSGYLRMYSLLQAFAVAAVLLFVVALPADPPPEGIDRVARRRDMVGLVAAFWLAVFTHLAAALLWPFMAVTAVWTFGRQLLTSHRNFAAALLLCLAAPLLLVVLSATVGPGAGTRVASETEGIPGISFLGEDKVEIDRILRPDPAVWTSLFRPGPLALVLPLVMSAASTALLLILLLRPGDAPGRPGIDRRALTLLALYWGPVLCFALLAGDIDARYGIFLVPLGAVIVAASLQLIVRVLPPAPSSRIDWGAVLAAGLGLLLLVHNVTGVATLYRAAAEDKRDVVPALQYVRDHRESGDPVAATTAPPTTSLILGTRDDLTFLAGGEGSTGALRYTRLDAEGQPQDYWLGVPAIVSAEALCSYLAASPDGWILATRNAWTSWGYKDGQQRRAERVEAMQSLIVTAATQVFADDDALVFRILPTAEWDAKGETPCQEARQRERRDRRENREDGLDSAS